LEGRNGSRRTAEAALKFLRLHDRAEIIEQRRRLFLCPPIEAPAVDSVHVKGLLACRMQKRRLFFNFSYVCPEPVLANVRGFRYKIASR
jgi:hypothetical protein